jgi:hypothetical protein
MQKLIFSTGLTILMLQFHAQDKSLKMYIEMEPFQEKFLEQIEDCISYRGDTLYISEISIISEQILRDLSSMKNRKKFFIRSSNFFTYNGYYLTKRGLIWFRCIPKLYIEE